MEQGYTYRPSIPAGNVGILDQTPSKTTTQEKYVIWHIQGGLGKNIAGTSLVKDIVRTYPDRKLVMVVSWPEVFLNNPDIHRVYQLGQAPYFYQDYVEGKDSLIFRHEPYHQTAHVYMTKHLIQNWCDLLGIEYTGQTPAIFVNYPQKMTVGRWKRNRPVMVLQTGGGPMSGQMYSYSWTRDMPVEIAQAVVQRFSKEYHIIQITRPDGYHLEGVERVDTQMSNIELFALLIESKKRVLIDSSLQHASAAFGLPATVLWVGTSPTVFGYDLHRNIKAKLPARANQLIGSYLFDYQFENNLHECPYVEVTDMFNIDEVLSGI
jgi:hypothetical protein